MMKAAETATPEDIELINGAIQLENARIEKHRTTVYSYFDPRNYLNLRKSSMKAMQVNTAKQGAVLVPVEMPQPEPGPDEILIHIHAAGVTPTELLWSTTTHTKEGAARTGAVPGHEFSGIVAALGANVRSFEAGDEVYGMNDWFADGATAEFCVTLPQNIAKKPASLSHEAAAAVPIAALTAWQGLLEKAKIQPGERLLVHGGAGAVGSFAVQLAHLHGAYVIATVSGHDIDFVKQIGADEAIDYKVTRFEEHVQNVDAVFDAVGGDTLKRSWSALKPGGRVVTIAADIEAATEQRLKDAFFIVEPNQKQLVETAKQLDEGHLKAFVKAIVPLEEPPLHTVGHSRSTADTEKLSSQSPHSNWNATGGCK